MIELKKTIKTTESNTKHSDFAFEIVFQSISSALVYSRHPNFLKVYIDLTSTVAVFGMKSSTQYYIDHSATVPWAQKSHIYYRYSESMRLFTNKEKTRHSIDNRNKNIAQN